MDDKRLYQQILGLGEPWVVDRVELDLAEGRVDVFVTHSATATWRCPHCLKVCALHDHAAERSWRHLDTCQLRTFLHARTPRVDCDEHGVCNVSLPWAEPGSHFTRLMEAFVIDVLGHCRNIKSAAALAGLSWDACANVMGRAVARGLRRREPRAASLLSVDEKRYRRGHVYATIVADADRGVVLEVTDGHKAESLAAFYRGLSPDQRGAIRAVAMDMHAPYVAATRDHLPDGEARIVFDRFHVMKHVNEALERVRVGEHRELRASGNDTLERARQMLLWADENRPAKYDDPMTRLRQQDLRTGTAWAMKENLRRLWHCPTIPAAREHFAAWSRWVADSAIKPMQHLARRLTARLDPIIRFCQHPITTAISEGLNSQIANAQHRAAGYRSFPRLRQAILFFCGGLDLYP
jgi:transposase